MSERPSRPLGLFVSGRDSADANGSSHPFACAVCHRSGDCDGGADNCDPTDHGHHVHYDCMESF